MTIDNDLSARTVVVLTRDLFFGMRIRNTLKQLGYVMLLQNSEDAFKTKLGESESTLALVDFNTDVDWDTVSDAIESYPGTAVIAFGPHTDTEGFRRAREAGVARVISNGAFSQHMSDLVERYANRG